MNQDLQTGYQFFMSRDYSDSKIDPSLVMVQRKAGHCNCSNESYDHRKRSTVDFQRSKSFLFEIQLGFWKSLFSSGKLCSGCGKWMGTYNFIIVGFCKNCGVEREWNFHYDWLACLDCGIAISKAPFDIP